MAPDKAACQETLQNPDLASGFNMHCLPYCDAYQLATTRGGEVKFANSTASLKQLLGTIDTAQEAVLIAFASGYSVCGSDEDRGRVGANPDGSFTVIGTSGHGCGESVNRNVLRISPSGELVEKKRTLVEFGRHNCIVGRRPFGLQDAPEQDCEDPRGRYFADAARLEAASIHSFLRLREELALHGADRALQDAALISAEDEVRHTEVTLRLASRYGAPPVPPSVTHLPLRSLTEMLLDNVVEGCVRETYGALVAHHQSLHALDPEIREAMVHIAEDETRHAALSWDVADWAQPLLSTEEQTALREAQRHAVEVLRAEAAVPLDAGLTAEAGLPLPEVARALLDTLEQELWT
ncbi:ferritin-like domain-containing protein [Corallococcus sp. bb12-1]|uniref:ferritin-like domain-containing protein n=1 Tax=Corallococcus sp. bb12-1 TaxID=2996784 RepID=UPI00226F5CEF|nr:ferritin-like domain-containing protein [Corallococcus sp. bb12-1]MCY1042369.1 ferritin-like domain-containing protein [Corallococcus sp. bb12-1]